MTIALDPTTGQPIDPCAAAVELRTVYYSLLTSGGEKMIRYKGPTGEEEVQFSSVNLEELKQEMLRLDGLCAAATGTENPNRRFAIRAGAMRKGYTP